MIPIIPGIIPFGAVMGSVSSEVGLSFFQTVMMNMLVFAGASQLAAVDLMKMETPVIIVLVTGLIINLRFLLYSAAYSPVMQKSRLLSRVFNSYFLTDQSYAVMSANEHRFNSNDEKIQFYLGAAVCMFIVWQISVIAGFIFGNFAPKSWALEYAIPLSFVCLLIPSLKNNKYVTVALFSAVTAVILKPMPYNLGLITTATLSILLGIYLSRKKRVI